jgi:hypothetical protein
MESLFPFSVPDLDNEGSSPGSVHLTVEERRRLRHTVDQAALERFLAAVPDVPRVAVIAHFAIEVYLEDLLAIQRIRAEAGDITSAELEAYERQMREPWPDDVPESPARSSKSGWRFVPVPHGEYIVQVEAPSDPVLGSLWDAIEPRPA